MAPKNHNRGKSATDTEGSADKTECNAIEELKLEFRESFKTLSQDLQKFKDDFALDFKELKTSVAVLKTKCKEKDQVIEGLTRQLNTLEQYGRNRNLEIDNIEQVQGEDVENIAITVAEKLRIVVKESDIEVAHRIPSKSNSNRPLKIIVQLASRKLRDKILAARRRANNFTSANIVGELGDYSRQTIYVNENLSPYFKDLLWRTKIRAKETGYKFVWFKFGKVLVRKDDQSRKTIQIYSYKDLDQLV